MENVFIYFELIGNTCIILQAFILYQVLKVACSSREQLGEISSKISEIDHLLLTLIK